MNVPIDDGHATDSQRALSMTNGDNGIAKDAVASPLIGFCMVTWRTHESVGITNLAANDGVNGHDAAAGG